MISSINSSTVRGAYSDTHLKTKEQVKSSQTVTKQGDTSRVDELKASIDDGSYRVDIDKLAKRIAQELA